MFPVNFSNSFLFNSKRNGFYIFLSVFSSRHSTSDSDSASILNWLGLNF